MKLSKETFENLYTGHGITKKIDLHYDDYVLGKYPFDERSMGGLYFSHWWPRFMDAVAQEEKKLLIEHAMNL